MAISIALLYFYLRFPGRFLFYDSTPQNLKFNWESLFTTNKFKQLQYIGLIEPFETGQMLTFGTYERPGVIKSTGQRIDLPQLHQIQSLFFDDQQRL